MSKVCTKCKLLKPLSEFHTRNDLSYPAWRSACKNCENRANTSFKEQRMKNILQEVNNV